jgi:hypothetical protein
MGKTATKDKSTGQLPLFYPEDFESNDGMLTTVWGPPMWHYLHTMSFNYPVNPSKQDKKNYREFVLKLRYTLPCGKCRENLKKNLKKFPILGRHMKNRASLSLYIFDLHELINKMLGKTSNLTYNQIRERYEHFRSRCSKAKTRKKRTTEKGCTEPLTGEKSKCVLNIVPRSDKSKTFNMDKQCEKVRISVGGETLVPISDSSLS